MIERVLCVGAHPDDVELAMGASVAAMVAGGIEVVIVDVSDGEPTPHGDRDTRLREAAAAARELGSTGRRLLGQPNRSIDDHDQARTELAQVLRETRPDLVFLPHAIDVHPDHVATSRLGDAARFWAKLVKTDMTGLPHWPRRVLYYRPIHAKVVLAPAFVLDVAAHHPRKMKALACYASQFADNPANRDILADVSRHDAYHGSLIRAAFGEPFFTVEVLGLRSLAEIV